MSFWYQRKLLSNEVEAVPELLSTACWVQSSSYSAPTAGVLGWPLMSLVCLRVNGFGKPLVDGSVKRGSAFRRLRGHVDFLRMQELLCADGVHISFACIVLRAAPRPPPSACFEPPPRPPSSNVANHCFLRRKTLLVRRISSPSSLCAEVFGATTTDGGCNPPNLLDPRARLPRRRLSGSLAPAILRTPPHPFP